MIEQQLNVGEYMAGQERSQEVAEADQVYAEAVQTLLQAAPQLSDQILELESRASWYAVALSESYFWSGLELGLRGKPKEQSDG